MRKTASAGAILGVVFLTVSATMAIAFNPQPDPPGKAVTNHVINENTINQTTLPPGPCNQMAMQGHGGGGTGKVLMMRKAGGNPSNSKGPNISSAHCLNPQPLPPG